MGGKSRKSGGVSKKLISLLKSYSKIKKSGKPTKKGFFSFDGIDEKTKNKT